MNSMAFIRDAKILINRMAVVTTQDERNAAQQQLDQLCNNMTNPSLPTAARLVEAAMRNKFNVDSRVIHKVNQFW